MTRDFTAAELPALFNEWMRRFTQEPERFEREFQSVIEFMRAEAEGKTPSYGDDCAAYLDYLRQGQ